MRGKIKVKKILTLILMLLLTVCTVIATPTNFEYAHDDGTPASVVDDFYLYDFNTESSMTSNTDITFPLVTDLSVTENDRNYISYSGRTVYFYGYDTNNYFTLLSEITIGDSDDEILGIVSIPNDLGVLYSTSSSLMILSHDTVDGTVDISKYTVTVASSIPTLLTKGTNYLLFDDTDMTPETQIDCDAWYDESMKFLCGYGTTTNKIVTFGTDATHNNIINPGSVNIVSTTYLSSYIQGAPSNVVVSHGVTYEIALTNISISETVLSNIVSLDIDNCGGDTNCTIASGDKSTYTTTWESNIDTACATRYQAIGSVTGIDYNYYHTYADADSGKIMCYAKKQTDDCSTAAGFNKVYAESINCIYNGGLIYDIENYNDAVGGSGDTHPVFTNIPLVVYDLDNDGNVEVCSDGVTYGEYLDTSTNRYQNAITCFDLTTGDIDYQRSLNSDTSGLGTYFTGAGTHVLTPVIFFWNETSSQMLLHQYALNNTYESSIVEDTPSRVFATDLNNDGEQELIQQAGSLSYIKYNYVIPANTLNTDSNLDYDGVFGFYNPSETNVTQTFIVRECDYENNEDCSYTLNYPNIFLRERLCTTCAGTVIEFCSDWSYTEPQINCTFDTAGTYDVELNMYVSSANETLAGQFTVNNLVVSATGNQISDYVQPQDPDIDSNVTTTTTTSTQPDGDGSYITSVFHTFESNAKSIIGLIIIIAMVATLAAQGIRNPIVLLLAGVVGTVIVSMIGLISTAVLVYVLISLVILIILSQTVFKSNSSEF